MATDLDATEHRQRWVAALGRVDEVFASPPAIDPVDGCTRCYAEHELNLLAGDPAQVPEDLARRFAEEVLDHWTEEQYGPLWRRLAPRILPLATRRYGEGYDVGLLLRGPAAPESRFAGWPVAERAALLDALAALLAVAVTDGRQPWEVIKVLGALGHIHDDLTPWFERLDQLSGPDADAGVVRLVCAWTADVLWEDEPQWWWYPENPNALSTPWLCSPQVRGRIERFTADHPRCKTATDALAGITALAAREPSPWQYPALGFDRWRTIGPAGVVDFIHHSSGSTSRG